FRARLEEQAGSMRAFTSRKGCEFVFIPPRAPQFGGLWEAGVKSAKHLFLRTVGNELLAAVELGTLLTSVEAVLNSRPAHLLIGGPLLTPPTVELLDRANLASLRRWRNASCFKHRFWQRWSREYIFSLQPRAKWQQERHILAVEGVVVVAEDNLPPLQWMVGRVTAVHTGSDGKVRVVDVKTAEGTYKRAIQRLAPLPVD
ncbi:hypothetical protein KR222_010683, partial [Zaprionus bogoriensis]